MLKRLLAAHLVVHSPSVDFRGTVTGLSLSSGFCICAVLPTPGCDRTVCLAWWLCEVWSCSRSWWVKRCMLCHSCGKLWLVCRDRCQHTRSVMNTHMFSTSRWCHPTGCISAHMQHLPLKACFRAARKCCQMLHALEKFLFPQRDIRTASQETLFLRSQRSVCRRCWLWRGELSSQRCY